MQELSRQLRTSHHCKVGYRDKEYFDYLGNKLLNKYQQLLNYYSLEDNLLRDLKESCERIKNGEEMGYNKNVAHLVCQELLQKETVGETIGINR
ncbi:MAG: hypothetical protein NY202_02795 [Mollicutes bacterium UO1]